ncbi:MAG: hypothetical protein NVS2B3_00750 [Vulcanimicrobiaceae bacterium]
MLLAVFRIPMALAVLIVASFASAGAQNVPSPQASASAPPAAPENPKPSPTPMRLPNALTVSGQLRGYAFDRENADQFENRSATNFSAFVHADYAFARTGLSLGASYLGAYPFGTNGLHPERNGLTDNTLPGATLSTFPETYLKYKSSRFTTTIGNQFVNEKWIPASDSRLKPAAYQGITASYTLAKNLTVNAARIIRFENRTSSAFTRNTLLTSSVLGGPALPERSTAGTLFASLKYAGPAVSAQVEDYSFYDLANLQYAEARANLAGGIYKPYVAVQYVGENQTGKALLGRVRNHTYGMQVGANLAKTVLATVSYNGSPTEITNTKAGIFRAAAVPGLANGTFASGSIVSPYSDGYVTDPLFTAGLTTGVVETRSARAFKFGLYYASEDKHLAFYATRQYYEHVGFDQRNTQYETDADVIYNFNKVGKGPYKGLSLRERYGVRNQPFIKANPSFDYVRTQLQYSF